MINLDSCYECHSLNIDYRFLEEDAECSLFEALCRDCGTSWIEEEDKRVNSD